MSGAAGGVAQAGQIARRLGAARVVGTAGSARKCRWLVEELGFDAAPHARFAVGGALAAQQSGAAWPRLDTQTAIVENLTVRAYAPAAAPQVLDEWPALFGRWLADRMVFPRTTVDGGLDAVPGALVDLLAGRRRGLVSVRVA